MPPPTPMTPPTDAGAIPPRPSSWPMVIGIIAIIFESLAALQGCMGIGGPMVAGLFTSVMPEEQAEMMNMNETLMPLMIISAGLTMVIAIVLLIGGIGLTKRSPGSPKTCRIWAGLKMVLVVYTSIITLLSVQAQMDVVQRQLAEDPNAPVAMLGFFGTLMDIIGPLILVFAILWGWALPIFMLIWFSRCTIKA